jgi:hypothetical protein
MPPPFVPFVVHSPSPLCAFARGQDLSQRRKGPQRNSEGNDLCRQKRVFATKLPATKLPPESANFARWRTRQSRRFSRSRQLSDQNPRGSTSPHGPLGPLEPLCRHKELARGKAITAPSLAPPMCHVGTVASPMRIHDNSSRMPRSRRTHRGASALRVSAPVTTALPL